MKTVYAILALVGVLMAATGCSTASTDTPPESAADKAAHDAATKAPTCALDMTAPFTFSGHNFFGAGDLDACNYTSWDSVLEIRASVNSYLIGVDIDMTRAHPTNTYDLGDIALAWGNDYAPCEGTVTWIQGDPDWSIAVNAVCHGETDYNLDALFHGHVYNGNN
jgi:hypothetical protein